jgi:hypothetical protein
MSQKETKTLQKRIRFIASAGGTPLSCPNTSSLNMTTTADAAQFIPRGEVAPRGAQHFRSDMWKARGDLLSEVSFILWSLSVHK